MTELRGRKFEILTRKTKCMHADEHTRAIHLLASVLIEPCRLAPAARVCDALCVGVLRTLKVVADWRVLLAFEMKVWHTHTAGHAGFTAFLRVEEATVLAYTNKNKRDKKRSKRW